jgi:hypothetical protein
MSWAFWIFLAILSICITGLVAQWRHQALRLVISDKQYRELAQQLGVTQRAFARLSKVVKPVVMKTLGPQVAAELLGAEES